MPSGLTRIATCMPMLPSPTMPRVLPLSSVPRNFFFSHFPALVDSLAWATIRASDNISAKVVLGDGDGVAARSVHDHDALLGSRLGVDVVNSGTGAADGAQSPRLREHLAGDLCRRANDQRVGVSDMRKKFLRVANHYVPTRLGFK